MEIIHLDRDITLMYVPAASFPEGVLGAHQRLHMLVPFDGQRKFLSVSRPERTIIHYKAGAEELQAGEASALGLDTLVLRAGRYLSVPVPGFMKDVSAIGAAFQQLLQQPGLDPEGYCVEWYQTKEDVRCMVRQQD